MLLTEMGDVHPTDATRVGPSCEVNDVVEQSRCGYRVGVEPKYFLGNLVKKAKSVVKGAVSRAKGWLSGTHRGVTVARALLGRPA
jgi:hypothetical protein